ncbi:helix-turn-helix domain-containing protein [Paenibacillus amylolyticus]|uniref:helix-turn-helix domain-containing protein n=1 Tax=Paenibacillus amylolyticus TaxID=1451 RepID=UPI00201D8C13|nr:helix-turn-helix domain-containing protein [Paenibacillus amylolyticus]MCL6663451.1 helix-turn-helix domain-containing protein [Paenibacillus amylolyticus]
MSNFISSEQQLLKGLKDVLDNTDLKTYEKMIMIVIKVYQAEHEQVFPDYDTIAAAGGMSKRKAQYVVKDLVNRNLIEKKSRFKATADRPAKQTSNQYTEVQSSSATYESNLETTNAQHAWYAQDAAKTDFLHAQHAPYNSGFINQDSLDLYTSTDLKEEEETPPTREGMSELKNYARYADVVEKMIKFQGTGTICFHQEEFLSCCKLFNLPPRLISELYPYIESSIQKYHFDSIYRALEKFTERLLKNKIDNPIAWFKSTFSNEDLKVRSEIELMKIGQVS